MAVVSRAVVGCSVWLGLGCVFTPPPPLPEELAAANTPEGTEAANAGPGSFKAGDEPDLGMSADEMKAYAIAQGDPAKGEFSLDDALAGLPAKGDLWAIFTTTQGTMECRLFASMTPTTVANFVGLARGVRPFRDAETGRWEQRPFYDGIQFHRVIEGFMIQGGDPLATGQGNAGYVISDEFRPQLRHDRAGLLSMANRGPGTGSSQFFVTLGPASHLDDHHTIFGECTDESIEVAESIAAMGGADDRPITPQKIESLRIEVRDPSALEPTTESAPEPETTSPEDSETSDETGQ